LKVKNKPIILDKTGKIAYNMFLSVLPAGEIQEAPSAALFLYSNARLKHTPEQFGVLFTNQMKFPVF